MLQDKATLGGCSSEKQDSVRPFSGRRGAPPCGCRCKIASFARIPMKRQKKLKSCVNMPGIFTTYISYIKNMLTYQRISLPSSNLLPNGTRKDRSAKWSLWNFSLLWVQDQRIAKVMLLGIIILCYTGCEVDKTRHYHFRCTDGKRKHVETHTWRSEEDTMSWRSTFQPMHFRPISIHPRPWEQQWSSMKANGDFKYCPFHLSVQNKKVSTAGRSSTTWQRQCQYQWRCSSDFEISISSLRLLLLVNIPTVILKTVGISSTSFWAT